MALWQYTFHVLLKDRVGEFPEYLIENREEGFDDSVFWDNTVIKRSFFDPINEILPKGKSWCEEIDLYGHQESNLFEVFHTINDIVECVSFRIDFTSDYEAILRSLMEFLLLNGFVIVDENVNVIPFNFEMIKSIIDNSNQFKMLNKLSIP